MSTFIQYKGTDICMDFYCPECGKHSHFDGEFAYAIKCPNCLSYFAMPTDVPLKPLGKDEPKTPYLTAEIDEVKE